MACPLHDRRFELATRAAVTDGAPVTAHRVMLLQGDAVLIELGGAELHRAA